MKEKFSLKEKQDYHFKMCKVGATKIDKKTGQLVKVSDFERGAHCARANSILDYRRKCKTGEIKLKEQTVIAFFDKFFFKRTIKIDIAIKKDI